MLNQDPIEQTHSAWELRLLHASALMALFCVGVYASAFGPSLRFIARGTDVSLDTAGLMLTAFFVGSISASAAVAVWLHRRDTRVLTIWGLAAAAVGALAIGLAPNFAVVLAGGAVMGLGDGLIVASAHILLPLISRDAPSAINRLNLYFAIGAVAGPIWAGGVLATAGDRSIVYAGVAAALLATLVVMLVASGPSRAPIAATDDEGFRLPGNPTAWVMGVVLFLYVGAEFGLGSWVSAYAEESANAGIFEAALLTSGYWAALMLGRVLSSWYFARDRDGTPLLIASVAGAGISAIVLALTTGNIAFSAAAAFAAGLFLGPVWPTTMSIASHGRSADATAATVTMGNAGGVAIPWMQGKVLVGAGPQAGVVVTAVLCAAMLVIALVFGRRQD